MKARPQRPRPSAKTLRQQWDYRRLRHTGEDFVLLTKEPSRHKIAIPHPRHLDEKKLRGFVAEVGRHKGVEAEDILDSRLVDPKWVRVDRRL